MKKMILILTAAAILAAAAAGCSSPAQDPDVTETATTTAEKQLHTVPPTETAQLEWAPVDCEISLESSSAVLLKKDGFLTFALGGSTDDDWEMRFVLSEDAAATLTKQPAGDEYYLTLNGKVLKGTVTLSDDCTELTMKGGYTYSEICMLASEIRGL